MQHEFEFLFTYTITTASLLPADISLGSISCTEIKEKEGNKGILKGNSPHCFSSQTIKQDKDDFKIKHTVSLGCHLQTRWKQCNWETVLHSIFIRDFNWQTCKAAASNLNLKEKNLSSWKLVYVFHVFWEKKATTSCVLENSLLLMSYGKN